MLNEEVDVEVLERRIEQLEDANEVLREDRDRALKYKPAFEHVLDRLQQIGLIDPTPHARYLILSGKREL